MLWLLATRVSWGPPGVYRPLATGDGNGDRGDERLGCTQRHDQGDDIIEELDGADTLNGGDGNDTLVDNDGQNPDNYSDTLNGGNGNDTIYAGYLDNVDGGSGFDSLIYRLDNAPGALSFDFTAVWGGAAFSIDGHVVQHIEKLFWIVGTAFSDTITLGTPVGQHSEVAEAGRAPDTLTGGPGGDNADFYCVISPSTSSTTLMSTR